MTFADNLFLALVEVAGGDGEVAILVRLRANS